MYYELNQLQCQVSSEISSFFLVQCGMKLEYTVSQCTFKVVYLCRTTVSAWCYASDVNSIGTTVQVLLVTELPVEEVIWAFWT